MAAQQEALTAPAGRPPSPYDTRLVANVPSDIGTRLRLLAVIRGKPVGHVLTEILRRELPSSAELAEQVNQNGAAQ